MLKTTHRMPRLIILDMAVVCVVCPMADAPARSLSSTSDIIVLHERKSHTFHGMKH